MLIFGLLTECDLYLVLTMRSTETGIEKICYGHDDEKNDTGLRELLNKYQNECHFNNLMFLKALTKEFEGEQIALIVDGFVYLPQDLIENSKE